jgi:hypothetical protein
MVIKYARFPDGYASNLYPKVHLDTKKLVGLKSHDCHIIMQDLMPLALCRSLPETVSIPLIRLCKYFKVLYGKVIDVKEIEEWEDEIVLILCQLEMIFPPSFFDIMVHLTMHLAAELRIAGPVHYRGMWSPERFMGKVKNMVGTTSHPEGSIAESYQLDESLTFCSRYLHDCTTKLTRAPRHNENPGPSTARESYLTTIGKPLSAFAVTQLDFVSWTQAARCVLVCYPKITAYAE